MVHRLLIAGIIMLGLGSMAGVSTAAGPSASPATLGRPGAPLPHPAPNITAPMASPAHALRAHFGPLARSRFKDRPQQFPTWWGYPPYEGSEYPPEYPVPIEGGAMTSAAYPPFENFSERSRPPVFHQPGCRTDVQKVPSARGGGEQTINVTRCY
jgi:hypothetical protein